MSAFTERHRSPAYEALERKALKMKLREAIAWGVPDRESTGCSAAEFVGLLHKALKEIESLEAQLRAKS